MSPGHYLYAITEGASAPPGTRGLREAPVEAIAEGELVMVASAHAELRVQADEDDLWAHESVVESLYEAEAGSVLPMRFGTTLPDEDSVRAALRDRAAEWRAALDRVRGAIELGVRAQIDVEALPAREPEPQTPGAGAGPGTAYMLERLGQGRAAAEVAESIHGPLSRLARESSHVIRDHPRAMLKGAYLVEEDAVGEFQEEVRRLEESVSAAAITCTGPWPPYSFSSRAET